MPSFRLVSCYLLSIYPECSRRSCAILMSMVLKVRSISLSCCSIDSFSLCLRPYWQSLSIPRIHCIWLPFPTTVMSIIYSVTSEFFQVVSCSGSLYRWRISWYRWLIRVPDPGQVLEVHHILFVIEISRICSLHSETILFRVPTSPPRTRSLSVSRSCPSRLSSSSHFLASPIKLPLRSLCLCSLPTFL